MTGQLNSVKMGNCVISGFHSKIEKYLFHYLLAGTHPVIMALVREMKKESNRN